MIFWQTAKKKLLKTTVTTSQHNSKKNAIDGFAVALYRLGVVNTAEYLKLEQNDSLRKLSYQIKNTFHLLDSKRSLILSQFYLISFFPQYSYLGF